MSWMVGLLALLNVLVFGWGITRPTLNMHDSEIGGASLLLVSEVKRLGESNVERIAARPKQDSERMVATTVSDGRAPASQRASPPLLPSVATGSPISKTPSILPGVSPGLHFADTPCRTLGPFSTRDEAGAVARQMAETHLAASQRRTTQSDLSGYWVLMPPRKTDDEASDMLMALNRQGFDDAWLFQKGELARAISLGLYSRVSNAKRRAEQVRAAGFDVWVKPQQRDLVMYWLDYRLERGRRLAPALLSRARRLARQVREYPRRCIGGN